jgi:hypothetical protein
MNGDSLPHLAPSAQIVTTLGFENGIGESFDIERRILGKTRGIQRRDATAQINAELGQQEFNF